MPDVARPIPDTGTFAKSFYPLNPPAWDSS
jgi:hypothetical protein